MPTRSMPIGVRYSAVANGASGTVAVPARNPLDGRASPRLGTVARMSAVETTRHVALESAFNFRDLGGYPAGEGRRTRWRTLFRSDGLHRLTPADVEILRGLGLRTVIDLRTGDELEERGRFPVDAHPVGYHHLSLMDVIWDRAD